MLAYCLAPYERVTQGMPGPARRCIVDQLTPEILADGGYWEEAEISGDRAIVAVRAAPVTVRRLLGNLPVTPLDDPTTVWISHRATPIARGGDLVFDSPRAVATKPLAHLRQEVLTDQASGELQRAAEGIMRRLAHEPYIRLQGYTWPAAAKLLGYLARQGFGLNRVSTGTFPTAPVLDSGVRADENPLSHGGQWTNPAQPGNSNLQIFSNAIRSTQGTTDTDANAYWSATTFGPDSEVYWTMTTRPNRFSYGYLRLQSPGTAGIDGYFFLVNMETTSDNRIMRIDNGAFTQLGASYSVAHADGDAVGFEALGATLTVYKKTGAAWASVASRTDSTYGAAGSIGMGDKASSVAGVYHDFGGGTIVAAPVDPPAMGGHLKRQPLRPRPFAPGLTR